MKEYFVYYGKGKYNFNIPAGWEVIQNPVSEEKKIPLTIPEMVEKALTTPISSPGLLEIVHENIKVAIIVDDLARPTPVSRILPSILKELHAGGAKAENIDIVVALGTHRTMPDKVLADKVGEEVLRHYRLTQHNCHADDLVPIGRLITGGEVKINPVVAGADLKIAVGSIFPHPMNGFGGGAKNLMPGVANFDAIKEHHLHFTPEPGCCLGNVENNPFHKEVCRVAEMAQLGFIVNCVYNSLEEVVDVVAGDFRDAHMAGIEKSREGYAFRLDEPADLTIISAYPYDEGPQLMKPIVPASLLATRQGGAVIMVATCRDGMPEPMLAAFDAVYAERPKHTGRFAVDTFRSSKLFVEGAIDFNCAIFFALACAARTRITMVSGDLDEGSVKRLGFQYAASLEEAIDRESNKMPRATVNIFPMGGVLLPLTEQPLQLV